MLKHSSEGSGTTPGQGPSLVVRLTQLAQAHRRVFQYAAGSAGLALLGGLAYMIHADTRGFFEARTQFIRIAGEPAHRRAVDAVHSGFKDLAACGNKPRAATSDGMLPELIVTPSSVGGSLDRQETPQLVSGPSLAATPSECLISALGRVRSAEAALAGAAAASSLIAGSGSDNERLRGAALSALDAGRQALLDDRAAVDAAGMLAQARKASWCASRLTKDWGGEDFGAQVFDALDRAEFTLREPQAAGRQAIWRRRMVFGG